MNNLKQKNAMKLSTFKRKIKTQFIELCEFHEVGEANRQIGVDKITKALDAQEVCFALAEETGMDDEQLLNFVLDSIINE